MKLRLIALLWIASSSQGWAQAVRGSDYDLGVADDQRGLYAQAVADFTRAIASRPDAASYRGRGVAYEHLGRHDLAIADLSRAIALRPDFLDAYENRGVAYDQKGFYDRAIADYSRAIESASAGGAGKLDLAQTYFNRGAAFEHRRLYGKALADYRAAAALDPALQPSKDGLKRLGAATP